MKFEITRTSKWGSQPCEEAIKEIYYRVDERNVDSPNLLSSQDKENWYLLGTNHRVENGHIKRDFPHESWFVEISSLEELMMFIEKYGGIVIENSFLYPELMKIEIYDDYRE